MYTFDSRVRFSETDEHKTLHLTSLIDYLQDCSTFHGEDAGVGLSYMAAHHRAWYVDYWQIDILRLPKLGEKIRIGTLPIDCRAFLGLRNFLMETAEGERLVNAYSVWVLMDTQTQKPTVIDQTLLDAYPVEEKIDMEYLPRKIKVPKGGGVIKDPIRVNVTMLDSNHHMNNSQYVRIAAAVCDPDQEIHRIRVQYKKQEKRGAMLTPVVYRQENSTLVALVDGENETCSVVEFS